MSGANQKHHFLGGLSPFPMLGMPGNGPAASLTATTMFAVSALPRRESGGKRPLEFIRHFVP